MCNNSDVINIISKLGHNSSIMYLQNAMGSANIKTGSDIISNAIMVPCMPLSLSLSVEIMVQNVY